MGVDERKKTGNCFEKTSQSFLYYVKYYFDVINLIIAHILLYVKFLAFMNRIKNFKSISVYIKQNEKYKQVIHILSTGRCA